MARAVHRPVFSRQARSALACLALFFAAGVVRAPAQARAVRPPPGYVQLHAPEQTEGRKLLDEFRQKGWGFGGSFYLEFELHVLPRRGDERTVPGRLWGGRNDRGPLTRLVLQPGVKSAESRLLVQSGPEGAAWTWSADGGVAALGPAALFTPLAGTDLTAFDLQMPFLYWTDFVYEGVQPVSGRSANVFLFHPPPAIAALKPELTGVRVYLDTGYNAFLQAEELGAGGQPTRTITGIVLKKVHDQYVPRNVDLRVEATRNHTQFVVTAVALGQDFSPVLFEPARLADEVAPPPADQVEPLGD